ncbi:MAG: hypothetical protein ACUVQ2_06105 [Dissulfurimicrobium sp.]|uniref:hypothetical protein n=1 Tax=Dissulfurimicrobium sp. TaxID=2022436 RepID=UPI0040491434
MRTASPVGGSRKKDSLALEIAFIYISPAICKEWLEEMLTFAFADVRHCIFPPDAFDGLVSVLYKMGCAGTLWNRIIPDKQGANKRRLNAA